METLELSGRAEWHRWLMRHHGSRTEIWLVFSKNVRHQVGIGYEDALEEAICFGWIDSLVKRLDENRYARKFTPRKPNSKWSTANRRRYSKLAEAGMLQPSVASLPPGPRSGDAPTVDPFAVPAYIAKAIAAAPEASRFFEQLPGSQRRLFIGWVESAKREETRMRRLRETVERLAAGKRLGLK